MMMMTICFNEATRLLGRSRSRWREEEQMLPISSKSLQLIQIFCAHGRTDGRTNEGNPRGPRGPKNKTKQCTGGKQTNKIKRQLANKQILEGV